MADITNSYVTEIPNDLHSFDVAAFDDAIHSQGVVFVHFRATRCPVGMVDVYSQRRPHDDHSGCSNGFIYTRAGCMTCLFVGNPKSEKHTDMMVLDTASAQATAPRFYDGTQTRVQIAPFDRLYLANENIAVINWELHEAHVTGLDRLSFPPVAVQDLIDNRGLRYSCGTDFEVRGGEIQWLTQNRPGIDPESGRGRVYSVRYSYRPYFYVDRLNHELRVSQADDPATGVRHLEQMPQSLSLNREYVYRKEEQDPQAPNPESLRQIMAPADGGVGPR